MPAKIVRANIGWIRVFMKTLDPSIAVIENALSRLF
jgi:hypothetical protein